MDYEELRPFVLDTLKNMSETQVLSLIDAVERRIVNLGHYANSAPWRYGGTVTEHKMPKEDREKVREIINELIVEGIVGWGINELNPGPPHLKVTRHGQEVLEAGQVIPNDPDGYLKYLKAQVPNLDSTIDVYVAEALQAYLRGLMLASTVMLGGASEKAFLLLLESYTNAIHDNSRRQAFEKMTAGPIKRKFDEFRIDLSGVKGLLPKPLADDLEIQLDGVFNLIRTCRNDVGHPTGRQIDRRLAYANLQLFVPYCKRLYDLIDYFNKNPSK